MKELRDRWLAAWPDALACWGRFTQLRPPKLCTSDQEARAEGLETSFAMIRLVDHRVVINLADIHRLGLDHLALEILAHEIGHHVYCPADLTDQGRMIARINKALPACEQHAPLVANLYADLLLNHRLQRQRELDILGVFKRLGPATSDLWRFYMRSYEILWQRPRGELMGPDHESEFDVEGDALLAARLIRVYAKHWVDGARGFAALCLPYLLNQDADGLPAPSAILDTLNAGEGGNPAGLTEIDADEEQGPAHPSEDPNLDPNQQRTETNALSDQPAKITGQKKIDRYRGPMAYGELLRALGINAGDDEIARRYYRERALPHLIAFPTQRSPTVYDPLPEGLDRWEIGHDISRLNLLESIIRSPRLIPGVTTLEQHYGRSTGSEPERKPPHLYIGIDCSGSMPNPRFSLSYPVLAGTIMALSALRAGAKVMVVLSGEPGSATATEGFSNDPTEVLTVLTRYLGTGYAFGIHRLEDTFATYQADREGPAHVMVITDQDIFSMLHGNHDGKKGWTIAESARINAQAGATFVLHMPGRWNDPDAKRMHKIGWDTHRLYDWSELIAFAQAFSRKTFGRDELGSR